MSTMEILLSHVESKVWRKTIDISYREMKRAVSALEELLDEPVQFVNFEDGAMRDRISDSVNEVLELSTAKFWPGWKFIYKTEIVYTLSRLDAIRLVGELKRRLETGNTAPVSFTIERIRRLPIIR
ncbi:hypothetical protein 2050HW_00279 [Serratia phage vB_SmaM_ 2050HW]|uniref:Uncharacterized protein n=1 Tax=Serratia phage vB_SmaM_ 2050HW TaxID=2024252 RepID=A0A289ZU15_9CAUD|nr:hypothetical protein HWB23_gp279 [Serratia phage vB_SmaM_ 2050HW]ATA65614.1 hypothetical protein 2050HW_00279 [Serratia phage vB_SmaM_ 2050HW]UGO54229.1 hypothetical protein HAYMO_247 [Serratia phage vB_SmaM_Haymo]URG14125.1 hypothetical protein [Pectobacterium phage vB_ParM-25]